MARTKRKINQSFSASKPVLPAQMVYKVGGYVRLSVEDSGKPGADTMETQQGMIQSYVQFHSDLVIYKFYCDNGQTGTDFERPAFEQLLADIKTGNINCVIVKDLSRFGRNYRETGNFLERVFPYLGVRFIAINDNFDTLTAERNEFGFVVPLKNLMNETYSRDISKKIASAIAIKEKRGEFIGIWAPYGYSKSVDNSHKLVINEDTAPIVREIFSLRLVGHGYERIARHLNECGVLSPSAYLYQMGLTKSEKYRDTVWRPWNIKEILQRQVYLGHLVQGKRTQKAFKQARETRYAPEDEWRVAYHTHDAIIDEATYQAVQALAGERKAVYDATLGKNGSIKTDNLFLGLVYCADCGKALSRIQISSNRQGKRHFYYVFVCPTARVNSSTCTRKNLKEEELLEVVSKEIRCHLQIVESLEETVSALYRTKTASKVQAVKRALAAKEKEMERQAALSDGLYQSLVDGIVTRTEFVLLKENYYRQHEQYMTQLADFQAQIRELEQCSPTNPLFVAVNRLQDKEILTEGLIHTLISKIEYDGDYKITITFNFQNELDCLIQSVEEGLAG